jgi:hypothetical protein
MSELQYLFSLSKEILLPIVVIVGFSNISKIIEFLQGGRSVSNSRNSLYESISTVLMWGISFGLGIYIILFNNNFYKQVGIPTGAKTFQIRRKCAEIALNDTSNVCTHLMSDQQKQIYSKFGEAIMKCNWCTVDTEYFLYSISQVLMEYFIFLVVFGILTWRKNGEKSRFYIVTCSAIMIFLDFGIKYRESVFTLDEFPLETEFTLLVLFRYCYFIMAMFIQYFFGF